MRRGAGQSEDMHQSRRAFGPLRDTVGIAGPVAIPRHNSTLAKPDRPEALAPAGRLINQPPIHANYCNKYGARTRTSNGAIRDLNMQNCHIPTAAARVSEEPPIQKTSPYHQPALAAGLDGVPTTRGLCVFRAPGQEFVELLQQLPRALDGSLALANLLDQIVPLPFEGVEPRHLGLPLFHAARSLWAVEQNPN
jgi:hypothetical protein